LTKCRLPLEKPFLSSIFWESRVKSPIIILSHRLRDPKTGRAHARTGASHKVGSLGGESLPHKKLQALIIASADDMYRRGQSLAVKWRIKYPYDGPVFSIFLDENGLLNLKDMTQDLIEHPDPDVGLVPFPVNHEPFDEPKTNEVTAAYLKFNLWERRVEATNCKEYPDALKSEIEIVTTNLIPLSLKLLEAIAASYSISNASIDEPYTERLYCGLHCPQTGVLQAEQSVTADIQLKVEELNCAIADARQELSSISFEELKQGAAAFDLARAKSRATLTESDREANKSSELCAEAIHCVKELIDFYCKDVRERIADRKSVPQSFPEIELRSDGIMFVRDEWMVIRDKVAQMSAIEARVGNTTNSKALLERYVGRGVDLMASLLSLWKEVDEKGWNLALEIWGEKFLPVIEIRFGRLYRPTLYQFSDEVVKKIETINICLDDIHQIEKDQQLRQLQQDWFRVPGIDPAQLTHQLLSALPTNSDTQTAGKPSPKALLSKKKTHIPNEAEKIIIRAINDGLSEDRLCEFLDLNRVPPRQSWSRDQMYPWPGSYAKAWSTKGKIAKFWHRKINIYVQNIKRDFADRIKVTKSPR
jgi:hypothetical protein